MKQMSILLAAAITCIVLTGCQNSKMGWGGTHQVILENNKIITVAYDPIVNGYDEALGEVVRYCTEKKKDPVPMMEGRAGMYPTITYRCE